MNEQRFVPPAGALTRSVAIRFSHCDPAGIVYFPHYFDMFNGLIDRSLPPAHHGFWHTVVSVRPHPICRPSTVNGLTATSTRTVIIEPAAAPAADSTTTAATISTAQ